MKGQVPTMLLHTEYHQEIDLTLNKLIATNITVLLQLIKSDNAQRTMNIHKTRNKGWVPFS